MTKVRKDYRLLFGMLVIALLIAISIIPISIGDFVLPSKGGGMVHQDQGMSENIRLPCPNGSVGELWYRDDIGGLGTGVLPGGLRGTVGNSIAGNGNISACSFGPLYIVGTCFRPNDKIVIFDYFGNQIWSSGWWRPINKTQYDHSLSSIACSSTPMVDKDDRVVACDHRKIILIDASNPNNVHVDWIKYLKQMTSDILSIDYYPTPFSPSIVENESIIFHSLYV